MDLLKWTDPLSAAVAALSEAAEAAGRSIEDSPTSGAPHAALGDVEDKASALVALIDRIAEMPPFYPHWQAQQRLAVVLARWSLAAENATLAAAQRDAPALVGAAQTLHAGLDEFIRAAAARPRAGQA